MNKVARKIDKMRSDRGWSTYKLSDESGVPQNTIRKWFNTDTYPHIPGLEKICEAFGITMADFFSEGNMVELKGPPWES